MGMNGYQMILPLMLLVIDNEEDSQLLVELYHTYKGLLYKVAVRWFGRDHAEIEDVMATALEQMCRYVARIRKVSPDKRPAYVRRIIENVCRRRSLRRQREMANCCSLDDEMEKQIAAPEDVFVSAFDQVVVKDLLASYASLSERDRMLIWMRHVECMEYGEIAAELQLREGTVRTAVSRAKQRLQREARTKREDA